MRCPKTGKTMKHMSSLYSRFGLQCPIQYSDLVLNVPCEAERADEMPLEGEGTATSVLNRLDMVLDVVLRL